jgi:hypothetical protein
MVRASHICRDMQVNKHVYDHFEVQQRIPSTCFAA